ncbi:MAG: hypothetical protein ANABAC_1239 [Anaerolineae bacterium]|nr:MAG: hypothetical protein ANABAC_1239 [Anaerolineae bacterium]
MIQEISERHSRGCWLILGSRYHRYGDQLRKGYGRTTG